MVKKMQGLVGLLGIVSLVMGGLVLGAVLSNFEYITYLNVPSVVAQNSTVNASFQAVVNGTNATEYPALYARPFNATGNWTLLCSWPGFSFPGGFGNKTFNCSVVADVPLGNYTVRSAVHTNTRVGCSNVTYTPKPFDGCGDNEDKVVQVVAGNSSNISSGVWRQVKN